MNFTQRFDPNKFINSHKEEEEIDEIETEAQTLNNGTPLKK